MNKIGIGLLCGFMLAGICGVSEASDPIGGGPASTLSSTVLFLTSSIRERIDFPEASLEEVITCLQRTGDVPAEFAVKLE